MVNINMNNISEALNILNGVEKIHSEKKSASRQNKLYEVM
jgi:hypothetical protein